MLALVERYGKDTVLASVEEMISRTERAIRAEIARFPTAPITARPPPTTTARARRAGLGARAVTVKGDEMTFDFSESDTQRKGFVNCVYAATYGSAVAAVILSSIPPSPTITTRAP